jgi:hypothetical protein
VGSRDPKKWKFLFKKKYNFIKIILENLIKPSKEKVANDSPKSWHTQLSNQNHLQLSSTIRIGQVVFEGAVMIANFAVVCGSVAVLMLVPLTKLLE